ncbi:aromatic-L-amino-acid decarboxylase [Coniosporium apollinis CBS 100218]|uniref:Aromatic-L-amino-acid decarboxylase n=1 Tax=Coniosporium apollinis (strain CBS 100218) TaxID=1168221 RepID=R7YQB4_CONA1|nr:aromatic-L-amino-acid decarboxylase [Coniosporium apollinis CBS 100218]EON64014.1 aromatic-L-amino-acid decarboxylase [Coniosporium apollinis CBS 100218]
MNSQQFREAAHAAIEEIIEYNETLPTRRVLSAVTPGYLAPLLPSSAPTCPEPFSQIQPDISAHIMPGLTHWQHPNFMAFFPATTSYPSMLAELYSAAFTAPAFNWLCSPAVTELETVVLDWVAQMLGLPEEFLSKGEGGGVIQGTASEAIAVCMVAARERVLGRMLDKEGLKDGTEEWEDRKGELRGRLVALGSEQAHSSTQKGAIIAGTRYRSVPAPRQDGFRMTGKNLRDVLERCKREGKVPYYLTVSLGTTSTCAVDEFEEIAEVLKEWPDVWVHVDAAYAGAALVLPEYQHLTKAFVHFDSFDMNMHKWLLTNFDASCLFVRRRHDLTSALSITPSYLRNTFSDSGLVTDYRDWQIPLGRRFRALKIWFVLRSYGIDGLQSYIRNHIELGELFHSLVKGRPDLFSVLTGPAFALTVITVVPKRPQQMRNASKPDPRHEAFTNDFTPDAEKQALLDANAVTKEVYELVNSRGEIFITSGVVDGTYTIRIVSANANTEEKYIRRAFEILVETAEEVLGKGEANGSAS